MKTKFKNIKRTLLAFSMSLFIAVLGATENAAAFYNNAANALSSNTDADELPDAPYTVSSASIVINAETGQVLYENNAYDRLYPASITKILTALVALEKGDYSSTITMSETAVWGIEEGSSNIALDVGEKISFEDAMYAMMLESANEASLAIAEQVSGTIEDFCNDMNERAKELGCKDTHFVNSNGLHDVNHYTTAYDMALITKEAIKNPTFIQITSVMEHTIPATNKNTERVLHQETRMRLDWSDYYYPSCLGGKTGYTDEAGGTLVTWSEKNGVKLICVDMHTPSNAENYIDSIALLDYCFDNYVTTKPLADFSFTEEHKAQAESCLNEFYKNTNTGSLFISADTDIPVMLPKGYNKDKLETKLIFNASNADNQEIGQVVLTYKDKEVISTPITYKGYVTASNIGSSSEENPVEDVISTDSTKEKKDFNFGKLLLILILIALVIGVIIRILYVRKQRELYRIKREEMRRNNRNL